MGFFERWAGRKTTPPAQPPGHSAAKDCVQEAPIHEIPSSKNGPAPAAGATLPSLLKARQSLDNHDLPAALVLYEEILATAGDRADVLVTISGDLGATGHIRPIVELIAPRYDSNRHGPATGLNVLQAYLAAGDADAARHVLDLLFALERPELEERLHGYSNALAELAAGTVAGPAGHREAGVMTLSKPVWFYGMESIENEVLIPGNEPPRRVLFTQLAVPIPIADSAATPAQPPDEDLTRLARTLPLWFAETFAHSPRYTPLAALALGIDATGERRPVVVGAEWSADNLRQIASTSTSSIDYAVTGALDRDGDEHALILRIWDMRKIKERKQLTARWTPATADAELERLRQALCGFMEWTPYPDGTGLPFIPPPSPVVWLEVLEASFSLFVHEKGLLPRDRIPPLGPTLERLAPLAGASPAASFAWLTIQARAARAGLDLPETEPVLHGHSGVAKAKQALAGG